MAKDNYQYVLFPLCLLQKATPDRDFFNNLVIYVVRDLSKKIEMDLDESLRSVIYDYYRNFDLLPSRLQDILNDLTLNGCFGDEFFCGFDQDGDFNPEDDLLALKSCIEEYPELIDLSIEYAKRKRVARLLGINLDPGFSLDAVDPFEKYVVSHEKEFGRDPKVSLKIAYLLGLREYPIQEDVMLVFLVYSAIKSLIGTKKYVGTNKSVIAMRALGAKDQKILDRLLLQENFASLYSKLVTRHHIDKILSSLVSKKFLSSKVGMFKRLWLSTKLTQIELGDEIFLQQKKIAFVHQHQEQRKLEADCRKYIMKKLKGG